MAVEQVTVCRPKRKIAFEKNEPEKEVEEISVRKRTQKWRKLLQDDTLDISLTAKLDEKAVKELVYKQIKEDMQPF